MEVWKENVFEHLEEMKDLSDFEHSTLLAQKTVDISEICAQSVASDDKIVGDSELTMIELNLTRDFAVIDALEPQIFVSAEWVAPIVQENSLSNILSENEQEFCSYQFGLHVTSVAGIYSRTTQLLITPRYILVNHLQIPLHFRQADAKKYKTLFPGSVK